MSVKDITGCNPIKKRRGKPAAYDGAALDADAAAAGSATPGAVDADGNNGGNSGARDRQAPARRKAPTDSTNAAFEEWLRGRRPRDFLSEQVSEPGQIVCNGGVVVVGVSRREVSVRTVR